MDVDTLARMCARKQAILRCTPRIPNSVRDDIDNRHAVRMSVLIAMLNSSLYDLRDVLEDAGLLKTNVKYNVLRAHDVVTSAHARLSRIIGKGNSLASRQYNSLMDVCVEDVNNAILIKDPVEKQYNICISLCRLVKKYYDTIKLDYGFIPATEVAGLVKLLNVIDVPDDNIDFIVDSNITIKYAK